MPPRTPNRPQAQRSRNPLARARTPQYLVIGHICADLQADGSVLLGGTALYSALTAAKLGLRTAVLTKGAFGGTFGGLEIPSLAQYGDLIDIIVQEADTPTVFVNEYQADRRIQYVRQWAGPIDLRGLPPHWLNARIVHLGPVAQEIEQRQVGAVTPQFLGVTPQGWMRDWPKRSGGRVQHIPLRILPELMQRIDSVVVSVEELPYARDVVERVGRRRLGVITQGEMGARILHPEPGTGGNSMGPRVATENLKGFKVKVKDVTGAGDVFAAAFFSQAVDHTISARAAGTFANAAAALSLREPGPNGVPTREEVEALIKEQGDW